MNMSLPLGTGLFATCWFIHLIVWRLHRPQAYPIWLPVIFFGLPLVGVFVLESYSPPLFQMKALELDCVKGVLLHTMLSCSYICGYAGIIEYSPTAEILFVVNKHMPMGIPEKALAVDSLTEWSLTGKRINHLVVAGVVRFTEGRYELTQRGIFIACLSRKYRTLLGVNSMGEG